MGLDEEYAAIVSDIDWNNPDQYVEPLRRLAKLDHPQAMNALAVVLGDVDSVKFRDEIISLYTKAHELGSVVAAEGLSIQYSQWGEPELSDHWKKISEGAVG